MSDEQKRIIQLTSALGLALGALEVINLSPYNFNQDGVVFVIKKLKEALGTEASFIVELSKGD